MIIVPDPGHGSEDFGAQYNGIVERDWNLSFCRRLAALIHNWSSEHTVKLTRNSPDINPSLFDRGNISNAANADIYLSIHCNAHATRSDFHGLMTFHWPGNTIGRKVGDTIMRCAPRPLLKRGWSSIAATDEPGEDDDWLQRPRNVIISPDATAVLVEVGYLTNVDDAQSLKDLNIIDGIAFAVQSGLVEFLRLR